MKTPKTIITFVGGALLGAFLAVGFGTSGQSPPAPAPARNWGHVTVMTYPSGVTGVFDSNTGRIYMYDINLENCYQIRELTTLGEPMRRLR